MSVANSPLAPLVRKLELWISLSDADREAIHALPHTLRTLTPHKYIVREGDRSRQACLLLSGFAYRHKIIADGQRQIVSIHMKGDLVDLQNAILRTADHNVQALTDVEVAMIPHDALRSIALARPAVGEALWYDTLVDASIFREWVANVGRRDARSRTAHLLCEFALRMNAIGLGERYDYVLPMTQAELADALGLTSVHVNRTLKALDREGLISRRKRSVFIADWEKLARVGDFRSNYLHLDREQDLREA